jgi:hypothetical protein
VVRGKDRYRKKQIHVILEIKGRSRCDLIYDSALNKITMI